MPDPFLKLSAADRLDALATAQDERPDYLLEKDVWVVWPLEAAFASPFAADLAFKGGTSLSKAYGAIRRFSEDVDLTYDVRALAPDFEGAGDPAAVTDAQAKKWSKVIRQERLPAWVAEKLAPWLAERVAADGVPAEVVVQGCDIQLVYEAATEPPDYVKTHIKLEFGARDTGEPNLELPVSCYAAPSLPELIFPSAQPRVVRVERTFWEKATAAHVFCLRGAFRGADGFARHWHDLVRLDDAQLAEGAIASRDIAATVAEHKAKYFAEKAADGAPIDYRAAVGGGLQLRPEGDAYAVLEVDYGRMVEAGLLLDDAEAFVDVMARCDDLQARANAAAAAG